jgi:hypothetical protein
VVHEQPTGQPTGRQRDIQSDSEEILEWIPLISEKQGIVRQRRHGQSNLFQVKQVLQCWNLSKEDTMGDRVRGEESR